MKENFLNHKLKHNVSLNSCNEINTKMVDDKQEPWFASKPSADD